MSDNFNQDVIRETNMIGRRVNSTDSDNLGSENFEFQLQPNCSTAHPKPDQKLLVSGIEMPKRTPRKSLPPGAKDILGRWLSEHRFDAYPSDGEKRMLAYNCQISYRQVAIWFTNARQRILPGLLRADGHNPAHYTISRRSKKKSLPNTNTPQDSC